MIDPELTDPRNIWIVCEKAKIYNVEQALAKLIDENKIRSCTFGSMDPTKVRFLREHCWDRIKEKEKSCKAEGVVVLDIDANSLEVKGTKTGRNEMMCFLQEMAENFYFKVGRFFFLLWVFDLLYFFTIMTITNIIYPSNTFILLSNTTWKLLFNVVIACWSINYICCATYLLT